MPVFRGDSEIDRTMTVSPRGPSTAGAAPHSSRTTRRDNTPGGADPQDAVGSEPASGTVAATVLLQRAESRAALSSEVHVLLDEVLRVVAVSPSCARLLGRNPSMLRGRPLSLCAAHENVDALQTALTSLLAGPGASGRWDLQFIGAKGLPRTFECRAMNLLADPVVGAVVVTLRDVHEQRLAEATLRQANTDLTRRLDALTADRAVDTALSRVADLLQHCVTREEFHDVVWGSLPALLPALHHALYFESDDHLDFLRHRSVDDAPSTLAVDGCWALRTRRAHLSHREGPLRCEHVDADKDAACLPLVQAGHAFGLVVVTADPAGAPLPATEALDRIAGRLGVTLVSARGRRPPDDP